MNFRVYCLLFLLFFFKSFAHAADFYWVGDGTDNLWSNTDNWHSSSGGDGTTTSVLPGASDDVNFDGFDANSDKNCTVDLAVNVRSMIMETGYAGILDLNGSSFVISGNNPCDFLGGTINDTPGTSLFNITATGQIHFDGTTFGADVDAKGPIRLGGSVFNGTVKIYHNGSSGSFFNSGKNTFNDDVEITAAQTAGYYWLAGGDDFNGNLIVNNISSRTFNIDGGTLAAGRTITAGLDGVNSGTLGLLNFEQLGTTAQSITASGTAVISLSNGSDFNGNLTINSPSINITNCNFEGICEFNISNAGNGSGGNTFNGNCTFNHSGSNAARYGQGTADVFNGLLTLNSTGNGVLSVGHSGTGHQFNDDVTINGTGSGGMTFGESGGTITLASNKTIQIGGTGFTNGTLTLGGINQTTADAHTFNLPSSADLRIFSNCIWDGDFSSTAGEIYLDGSTYNGTSSFTKLNGTIALNQGGNTFNGETTISHNGPFGQWRLATSSSDDFNNNVTFEVSGSGDLYPAYSQNSTFSGNISFDSPSNDVRFGEGVGTVILDGSSPQTINDAGTSQTPVFANLNINASANTTLNTDIQVSTLLTMTSGNIISSSSTKLTVTDGGNSTGASDLSFVQGQMQKTGSNDFEFPVGSSVWAPIGISNLSGASTFDAEYFLQAHIDVSDVDGSLSHVSDVEYWNLDQTGAETADVTLHWKQDTRSGITNLADLVVAHYNSSTQWESYGQDSDNFGSPSGDITVTGVATFSPFTFGSATGVNTLTFGDNFYWVGDGGDVLSSNSDNWSNASGGDGTFTFEVPSSTSTIYYDGIDANAKVNSNISTSTTVENIYISSAYSGTISLNDNLTASEVLSIDGPGAGTLFDGASTLFVNSGNSVTISNAEFDAPVSIQSATISDIANSTFNSTLSVEKTGSSNDEWSSGNTYNGNIEFTHASGSTGYFSFEHSGSGSSYNGTTATFHVNSSSQKMYIGTSGTTNFDCNVVIDGTGSGSSSGVRWSHLGAGVSTMSAGTNITVSSYTAQDLFLKRITQGTGGTNSFSNGSGTRCTFGTGLSLGGNTTATGGQWIAFENNTTFGGTLNITENTIILQGDMTVAGNATFNYSGGNVTWDGDNDFQSNLTLNHSGFGYLRLSNTGTASSYQGDLTLNNTGSGQINIAETGTSTITGNIILSSTNGNGIYFGAYSSGGTLNYTDGSTVLNAGSNIQLAGAGTFSNGALYLNNFTQNGSTSSSLAFTGSGSIRTMDGSSFGGDLTVSVNSSGSAIFDTTSFAGLSVTADHINIDKITTTGLTNILCNATSDRFWEGGNVFGGATTIEHSGSQRIWMASNSIGDTFNDDVTFINSGSSAFLIAKEGTSDFNGNISVECTGSASVTDFEGIWFGEDATQVNLASNKSITIGPGGWTTGELKFKNFIQNSTSPAAIVLSSSSDDIKFNFATGSNFEGAISVTTNGLSNSETAIDPATIFNGPVTIQATDLYTQGGTFNAATSLTKVGATLNSWDGSNQFNAPTQITVSNATGEIRMDDNNTGDDFNADVTFNSTVSGGKITIAYGTNSKATFAGNVLVNAQPGDIIFGNNSTNSIEFDGSVAQLFQDQGLTFGTPTIPNFVLNNSSTGVTLTDINFNVSGNLTFTNGILNTNTSDYVTMLAGSSVAGTVSDISHVNGPIRKVGNTSFEFPTGNGGVWAPITLENITSSTTFTAEYHFSEHVDSDLKAPLKKRSFVEYWDLDPSSGTTADITLHWKNQSRSGINDASDLVVTHFDGSEWETYGQNSINFADPGSITVTGISTFSPFTFGSLNDTYGVNPLPVELTTFEANLINNKVYLDWITASEINNEKFIIERSANAIDFSVISEVKGAGNSNYEIAYSCIDDQPLEGTSYYRIKQVDVNGGIEYSATRIIEYVNHEIQVYPSIIENGELMIKMQKSNNCGLNIVNSNGQLVLSESINNELNSISVNELAPGYYFVYTFNDSSRSCAKILVK